MLTRLVYIGGYGHSGSTLLEYLIACSPTVMACGEVASTIREGIGKRKKCTCGRNADQCFVWRFFYSPSNRNNWTHAGLLRALMQQVEGRYGVIVDSSKTAWGSLSAPFQLKHKFGSEFMLVHLIREPTAVCWSVLKQKNRRAHRAWRKPRHYTLRCSWVILGWSLANLTCDLFGMLYPQNYVRLHYEDLARSPAEALGGLFPKLLPNGRWESGQAGASGNRHQLHGNKVRYRKIAFKDVKEDLRWKVEMPPEYSRVIRPLSYLLRVRYGYS